MNKDFETIIQEAQKVTLTTAERDSMRLRLSELANIPNVISSPYQRHIMGNSGTVRTLFGQLAIFKQKKYMPAFLMILAMLAGGTTAAAKGAIPGDLLYPVKIHATEEVQSWFSVGDKSTALTAVEHAQNRLAEAEQLAADGKLTTDTAVSLEQKFSTHADEVQQKVATLQADGKYSDAADVSSDFETILGSHQAIIAGLAAQTSARDSQQLKTIARTVDANLSVTANTRESAEGHTASSTKDIAAKADEARLNASTSIRDLKNYIYDNRDRFSTTTLVQANARVELASSTYAAAQVKFEAQAWGEAYSLFRKAYRTADETRIMLVADAALRIDGGSYHTATSSEHSATSTDDSWDDDEATSSAHSASTSIEAQVRVESRAQTGDTRSLKTETQNHTWFKIGNFEF